MMKDSKKSKKTDSWNIWLWKSPILKGGKKKIKFEKLIPEISDYENPQF